MGPFRQVQWGALYPVLSRLEREGLIEAQEVEVGTEERGRKVYAITEAGLGRLHQHLMDTASHLGEYDRFFANKVALFPSLEPAERLHLARDYAVHAQRNVDHLMRKCRQLCEDGDYLSEEQRACILNVMEHRAEYWRREHAWAEEFINECHTLEVV
jgi:DNA-binding PadR family transcriptional regulator